MEPYLDPSVFWQVWQNTQNFNQAMFSSIDNLWKVKPQNQHENLLKSFTQEYMNYISFNTGMAIKLLGSLTSNSNPIDLLKITETSLLEFGSKNLEYFQKLLNIYYQIIETHSNMNKTDQHVITQMNPMNHDYVENVQKNLQQFMEQFQKNTQQIMETLQTHTKQVMDNLPKSNNPSNGSSMEQKPNKTQHQK